MEFNDLAQVKEELLLDLLPSLREFHQVFNIHEGIVVEFETLGLKQTLLNQIDLRYELFKEELQELKDAEVVTKEMYLEEHFFYRKVQIADALTDMLYLALGSIDIRESIMRYLVADGVDTEILSLYYCLRDISKAQFAQTYVQWIRYPELQPVLEDLFYEVHSSNMSKLGYDGLPLLNGVNTPMNELYPKGKIMKSDKYFKPDLASIVKKYTKR